MGVAGSGHTSTNLPPKMTPYPLYRRLSVPHGRSGRVRKMSPPTWNFFVVLSFLSFVLPFLCIVHPYVLCPHATYFPKTHKTNTHAFDGIGPAVL